MSTELGFINDISATRFWGGDDRGVCLQLTNSKGFVIMSAAEIIAMMPAFKSVIDTELERRKNDCEKAIEEYRDLEKSIVSDMRDVAKMAISQPVLEMASTLNLGGLKLQRGDS